MARQISDLPSINANEVRDDDLILIRDASSQTDKKLSFENLFAALISSVEDNSISGSVVENGTVNYEKFDSDVVSKLAKQMFKVFTLTVTTDSTGNARLEGISQDDYDLIDVHQVGTTTNSWTTVYGYDKWYYLHAGNWNGTAKSGSTFNLRVVCLKKGLL